MKKRGRSPPRRNTHAPPLSLSLFLTHPHNARQRRHVGHLLDGRQKAAPAAPAARDGVGELVEDEGSEGRVHVERAGDAHAGDEAGRDDVLGGGDLGDERFFLGGGRGVGLLANGDGPALLVLGHSPLPSPHSPRLDIKHVCLVWRASVRRGEASAERAPPGAAVAAARIRSPHLLQRALLVLVGRHGCVYCVRVSARARRWAVANKDETKRL